MKTHFFLAGLVSLGLLLPPSSSPAADLATATSPLFSGSGNCAFCHDQWGGALLDQNGHSVSITEEWRGTMMAHSFQDPLWRAVMEAEVAENPSLKSYIEDKCQTCHAPMARTQHRQDHDQPLSHSAALETELAKDGVSCTLCHQIQADHLGDHASFAGKYVIRETRQIFGPYKDVVTMPMQHHVNYEPQYGEHVQDSALCATCHTLFTPIVRNDAPTEAVFAEQVPYLEWKASAFARENRHCQDCHMPRLDEPIKISARPPWLDPREPFWRHEFVGGNSFMLQLMASSPKAVQPNADPDQLRLTLEKARAQLRRAARLNLSGTRTNGELSLQVQVENLSGHKFPTGHPYRRAWLHVTIKSDQGRLLFESGKVDTKGRLLIEDRDFLPHYQEITRPDQVQVYEAVMADLDGQVTRSLLRAASLLKDNRLPPRGFDPQGEDAVHIAVRGQASHDPDFNAGLPGRDTVTYRLPLPEETGPLDVSVALLYQSVPPEAVDRLMTSQGQAARTFKRLYRKTNPTPETVHQSTLRL